MRFRALPVMKEPARSRSKQPNLFVLLMLLFGIVNYLTAQSLTLEYKEIDASGFSQIVSFVSVRDNSGAPIAGLTEDNFTVREDGQLESPIEVLEISEGGEGITAALVLDRSSSMRGQPIEDARSAASNFVRLLQPRDRAAVVAFNELVTTVHPFSSDTNSLVTAISGIQATGETAMYDAVIHTVTLTRPETGRRVIILLTDGADTASRNSFRQALRRATDSGIPIFTIGLSLEPGSQEEENLITLAENTAGRYYRSPTSSDLQQIYAAIAAELRNQYKITYNTHNPTTDGTRRLVHIEVQNGAASSDTSSYLAPEYVVTIAPSTTDRVSPAREFTLDFEIPQNSNYLRHQMKSLTIQLEYNSNYLKVKQPQDQNVLAGALFGPLSEHTISASVDQANGVITLELSKIPASGLIEGRGMLAHITFQASGTMPDSTML
ncbi:VWA domain-containing protein, partial [candidate division KSB1 bacterium]|nr:VWA domain-containing protein [candidate division KSB1 bacterium]NIX73970.1 VWA domain-containing protein [candidate division KSB1 bacterium]